MNLDFISRVVGLVQKTGDRVVLADPQSGKAVVVLDLESYERLCAVPNVVSAPAQAPVAAPVTLPPEAPKIAPTFVQKVAQSSQKTEPKTQPKMTIGQPSEKAAMADLTQEELLDKINRDIGLWKTAQERRHSDELTSVTRSLPRFEAQSALEEEERFYLEPIE